MSTPFRFQFSNCVLTKVWWYWNASMAVNNTINSASKPDPCKYRKPFSFCKDARVKILQDLHNASWIHHRHCLCSPWLSILMFSRLLKIVALYVLLVGCFFFVYFQCSWLSLCSFINLCPSKIIWIVSLLFSWYGTELLDCRLRGQKVLQWTGLIVIARKQHHLEN